MLSWQRLDNIWHAVADSEILIAVVLISAASVPIALLIVDYLRLSQ